MGEAGVVFVSLLNNRIVILVGGFLIGVLFTALFARYLASRRKIQSLISEWNLTFNAPDGFGGVKSVARDAAEWAEYSFTVELYNEKDVATSLRDPVVKFLESGFTSSPLRDLGTGPVFAVPHNMYDRVESLNLPSNEWVTCRLGGRVDKADLDKVSEQAEVMFIGHLPRDEPFKREIEFPDRSFTEGREGPNRKAILDTYLEIFKQVTQLSLASIAGLFIASSAFKLFTLTVVVLLAFFGLPLFMALIGMYVVLSSRETGRPITRGPGKRELRYALDISLGLYAGVVLATIFITSQVAG